MQNKSTTATNFAEKVAIVDNFVTLSLCTHPKGTAIALLIEPVHSLEDLKELEDALQIAEDGVLLEVELDEFAQRLGLVGVDNILGEELVEAHLLLQILKVGLLVQRNLGHVLEVAPDLDAAELDGRVQVQRFKVLLEVVVPHLQQQK